jgi:hypothetical protein
MNKPYASKTTVNVEKTKREIEAALKKYGADSFGTMEGRSHAAVMFEYQNLAIQIKVRMPSVSDFMKTPTGLRRTEPAAQEALGQEKREIWRAVLLLIKGKLVAVERGITTIEREFLSDVLLPSGLTMGETIIPKVQEIASTGQMPKLLGGSA